MVPINRNQKTEHLLNSEIQKYLTEVGLYKYAIDQHLNLTLIPLKRNKAFKGYPSK